MLQSNSNSYWSQWIWQNYSHYCIPVIKQQFTDGFIFVELGPQAPDPSIKLCQLYHLLTGENLISSDTNYAEQEIEKVVLELY